MASSDTYANAVLLREVSLGGSVWLGLLDAVPAADLSTFSLIADIPTVELPLDGATSWVVAARVATLLAPVPLDTSGLVANVVPVAWCLFTDEAGTLPRLAGRLADLVVTPDAVAHVPAATVAIRYPATAAGTL